MNLLKSKAIQLSAITLLLFINLNCQASATWLDGLIAEQEPYAQVAVVVEDLNTQQRLIDRRAGERFIPASVTKLFTSTAALLELGPDYRINTSIYFDPASIKNHKLTTPLWLVFHGDPSLSKQDLTALLQQLNTNYGVTAVDKIYVDDQYFANDYWPFGITWNSLAWAYMAPVSSIIIDRNSIPVQIDANTQLQQPAHIKSLSPYLTIQDNGINTVSKEYAEKYCHLALIPRPNNHVAVSGCWPQINKEAKFALSDPRVYLQAALPSIIKTANLKATNKISFKTIPTAQSAALTQLKHQSPTVAELLHPTLFESDNLVANALGRTLAAKREQNATLQLAAKAILDILQEKLGHDWHQELMLKDGAGASYNNLVTPNSVIALLTAIAQNPALSDYILPTLPKPGSKEIYQIPAELLPMFIAKSGTMNNNMNLAGYILENNKPTHTFVIFINNAGEDEAPSRKLQGQILQAVYRQIHAG